jgi:hypothetical protein
MANLAKHIAANIGTAKAWFEWDQATPAIVDSFNVSSMDDDSTGDWGCNLTSSFASSGYAITASSVALSSNGRVGGWCCYDSDAGVKSASGYDGITGLAATASTNGSPADYKAMNTICGDLA